MSTSECKNYYQIYNGSDVYRVKLNSATPFTLPLTNGEVRFQLFESSLDKPWRKNLPEELSGWLYPYKGDSRNVQGYLNEETRQWPIHAEDLFWLRSGGFQVTGIVRGLFLEVLVNQKIIETPPVVNLPTRSERLVDWVGPWVSGIEQVTMHVAREGSMSDVDDNPKAELPLHYHRKTIEAYFCGQGRSIIMVDRGEGLEKIPIGSGDLVIVTPGVKHGLGNPDINTVLAPSCEGGKSYSGTPYRELAIKIPADLIVPVDRYDKFTE